MDLSHPLLLEVNTRCWLRELSEELRTPITLENVPSEVIDQWSSMGYTHIWLMGVWTVGARSRDRALQNASLRVEYDSVLPGWTEKDVWGSPYAIARYTVAESLGADLELATFRQCLAERGMKLILDFVPNHVGLDHPWLTEYPDRFVQCPVGHSFGFEISDEVQRRWIAHGKDPHFQPWTDTAQMDYRLTSTQAAMTEALLSISNQCDGVRCDMAMLLLREVFETTWAEFPPIRSDSDLAGEEFWQTCITQVRAAHPEFLFMAEAYWGLETELQQLGFDFTYDKQVTDALVTRQPADLTRHLSERSSTFTQKSVHFLENHDEQRVASILPLVEHRAAALAVLALPGMRLLHDGQTTGARIRTPVQLATRPREAMDVDVELMYRTLLDAARKAGVGKGSGRVLPLREAWAGNSTFQEMLVIEWISDSSAPALVVINLAAHQSQCRVHLEWSSSPGIEWELRDILGSEVWRREPHELRSEGLFLDLAPHSGQLFVCQVAR